MPETNIRYRKLPGRRRGIGTGSSLWLAPDHLLLVRTRLFREEYKRFYLRDIQAIAMANYPRFYVSTRSLAMLLAWLSAWLFWTVMPPGFAIVWWAVFAIMVGVWLVFSFFFSCRCRLYTAVSNDALPSLYRTWTARKFLEQVRPRIEEAQGRLDANWAEAIEEQAVGPVAAAAAMAPAASAAGVKTYTAACLVLLACLLAGAAVDLLTVRYASMAIAWVFTCLTLVQMASAVYVMIERQRRILGAGMQRVALAALMVQGLVYYVAATTAAFIPTGTFSPNPFSRVMLPQFVLARQIAGALNIVVALIGLAVILRPADARPPDIIKN